MARKKQTTRALTRTAQGYVVHARGLEIMRQMVANGHPQSAIASALGINKSTLCEVKKRDDQVADALQLGLGELEHELVHSLLEQARKGNIAAAMFLLKTRHGYRENGPTDGAVQNTINIQIPEKMPEEKFMKLVNGERSNAD